MEIIPLITIEKRKIIQKSFSSFKTNTKKGENKIYILDLDGIKKNRPNLCTYQKLSKYYDIWADSAPKELGDVVDSFMSGVTSIVIRQKEYANFNPSKIKEISNNNIFLTIENEENETDFLEHKKEIDGFINFKKREQIQSNFKYKEVIKPLKESTYNYEENHENLDYWKKSGIKGLIVDIDKINRFR